jgi:alpha-glucosidase
VTAWWDDAVLYQIYPRSFADSNGDGIGDLRGITAHLEHLAWLGVDGCWLSPTFPSPNADWGYDVSDYLGVHPDLGTQADMDALLAEAERLGLRVLLDLVPNHTSVEHPWFVDARSSRDARHRDWYVWADPVPDGGPPNNWASVFTGSAWTLDTATGQYYLQNFLAAQADLNWWNDEVRDEFDGILRSWFDRGVSGFRIDVAHMIVKDHELRANPPATPDDTVLDQLRGQRPEFTSNRPEVHEVHRHWRSVANEYDPPRLLVGETFVDRVDQVVPYYGVGDELGLAFNIPFLFAPFEGPALRALVEETLELLPDGCVPVWTGSNHDVSRFPTRWAAGNHDAARCALTMLLTLPGCAFLYYGDELGMPDTAVPDDRLLDPVTIRLHRAIDRDAARTPMPWSSASGGGFTDAGIEPWLPFGDLAACNVADQRDDPTSTLHLARDLIALRRARADLRGGACETATADGALWAWRRGTETVVALNLGETATSADVGPGTILLATDRTRDGEEVDDAVTLEPWTGLVVATG